MSSIETSGRLVIGIDGSPAAAVALRWGIDWAAGRELPLAVVTGYDPKGRLRQPPEPEVLQQEAVAAQERLDAALELARARGLDVVGVAEHADRTGLLVQASEGADAVVIGTRGLAGERSALIGGNTDSVVAHARCTAVVVPEGSELSGPGPVVVAVDGSAGGEKALEFGFAEAQRAGVALVAVSVVEEDQAAVGEADVEAVLAPHRDRHPGVEVQVRVEKGVAASAKLVEAAKGARMLAMGSRGLSGFTGMLLGSTSRSVARNAPCPVAVVR